MATGNKSSKRLPYLDWLRGLAAIMMINGHVFHSFTHPDYRQNSLYVLTQFVGGMPPAVFLFLLGVTLAFLMESRRRQGLDGAQRVKAALKRAGFLFGVAFAFRVQLWLVGLPQTHWTDLFRVDILNAMGLAVLCLSPLAALNPVARIRAGLAVGLAVAFLSPLVSWMNWSWLPKPLAAYIVPSTEAFAFFPWAAFVAFGLSAGSILRMVQPEQTDRLMQWVALLGLVLILGARYFSGLPYSLYPASNFWLDSPWLILIKLGVVLLALSAAYLWTQYGASPGWSWVRQFGMTSLLVYWVHTELVYGRWLYFWKDALSPLQCAVISVAVILLMLGLSLLKSNWRRVVDAAASVVPRYYLPSRSSGD